MPSSRSLALADFTNATSIMFHKGGTTNRPHASHGGVRNALVGLISSRSFAFEPCVKLSDLIALLEDFQSSLRHAAQ